jgi:TPR repeat protein
MGPADRKKFELLPLAPDREVAMLTHAAEHGNADAAYMLAMIYESGAGVPRDLAASTRWLHRAAELDYERVIEQLSRRCDDLLQRLLTNCDAMLQNRQPATRNAAADEMRRSLQALADSTHDLKAIATMGRLDEQRNSA